MLMLTQKNWLANRKKYQILANISAMAISTHWLNKKTDWPTVKKCQISADISALVVSTHLLNSKTDWLMQKMAILTHRPYSDVDIDTYGQTEKTDCLIPIAKYGIQHIGLGDINTSAKHTNWSASSLKAVKYRHIGQTQKLIVQCW